MIDPRLAQAFLKTHGFALVPHLLVLGLVGSHSHGTYIPPAEDGGIDDLDLMGFVVPPLDYHLGLPNFEHWVFKFEELDVVLYSLEKAVRLLLKSNPNIVGMLWLREEDYQHRHPHFSMMLRARHLFASKAAHGAFVGYAYGQLKRMEAFDEARMVQYDLLRAEVAAYGPIAEIVEGPAQEMERKARTWGLHVEMAQRFRKLHKEHFSGYMGEKRKAMVRKHQYDVKNAAHLIRLLRMGEEFLRTGNLRVYRTDDAEELKAIKRGEWTLESVKAHAESLFERCHAAADGSDLPEEPDGAGANALLVDIQARMLGLSVAGAIDA